MIGKPVNHLKPWTRAEVDALFRLLAEGTPVRAIAKELGRTMAAVEYRAGAERRAKGTPTDTLPVADFSAPPTS